MLGSQTRKSSIGFGVKKDLSSTSSHVTYYATLGKFLEVILSFLI